MRFLFLFEYQGIIHTRNYTNIVTFKSTNIKLSLNGYKKYGSSYNFIIILWNVFLTTYNSALYSIIGLMLEMEDCLIGIVVNL